MPDLYPSLLGASWADLAPVVRRIHTGGAPARGSFQVRRGPGRFARLVATLLRMPPAGDAVPVSLAVARAKGGERWTRTFGDRPLSTVQWRRGDLLVEAFGLVQCWFRVRALKGGLVFEQARVTLGFRGFALPLPRWLAPVVEGRVAPSLDHARVEVRISAPLVGLVLEYIGKVAPAAGEEAGS